MMPRLVEARRRPEAACHPRPARPPSPPAAEPDGRMAGTARERPGGVCGAAAAVRGGDVVLAED